MSARKTAVVATHHALAACLAAGASEAHGVWGGVDRSKPTRKTSTKEMNR